MAFPRKIMRLGASRPARASGAKFFYGFNFFNAISFNIVLGTPLVLFAQRLEAPAVVLGILVAMAPLCAILEVPAAHLIPHFGYRRMLLWGFGLRTLFIFSLAGIAWLAGKWPSSLALFFLSAALLGFNVFRGLSAGVIFPWMTDLIPERIRVRFLSWHQAFMHLGALLALWISAALVGRSASDASYAAIFVLATVSSILSLVLVSRVPRGEKPAQRPHSSFPVPWKAIVFFRPFDQMLGYNVLLITIFGGLLPFSVSYLKEVAQFSAGSILWLQSLLSGGALLSLGMAARLFARLSARASMRLSVLCFLAAVGGWFAVAGGLCPPRGGVVALLCTLTGMGFALFNVINSRILMEVLPPMGRNHFFALFTVLSSLWLGLVPILWGWFLDAVGDRAQSFVGVKWNGYSIYFGVLVLLAVVALLLAAILPERARPMRSMPERDFRMAGRARRFMRLFGRF